MLDAENLVGCLLSDRYDVLTKIGAGGMAMVYKAHDKVLDRNVAIKILRDSYEEKQEIVSNFIKEARSSASLVHPNVVSVYDVCEYEGINYMVMELVDGITLKEYIKKHPRLPWQEACDYAIQIGQGIQAAHERGIIHRDIKPQNIIMAPGGVLKVTDFGIAKAMESDKTIAGGTALGSVHYISPEQAKGGFTDFRSDIYSLGIVLYEMLAGRVPFDGDSPVSVALMHIEEEPVNVKCVNMDVPADLAYVTMKAMNRDQTKRYQKMQDLLDDLRAVLADETLPSKEIEEQQAAEAENQEKNIAARDQREQQRKQQREPQRGKNTKRNQGGSGTAERNRSGKKSNKKKREERNSVILALSTIAVIGLVAAGFIIIMFHPFNKTVPDLKNLTLEEAKSEAQSYGYTISDELEYSLSDTVAVNCVISQLPEAGTEAPKSEPIKLIISLGTSGGGITVPDVKHKMVDEAGSILENETLTYKIVSEYSSDIEYGYVIRQTPESGTHVNSGDIVTLHVSIGPEPSGLQLSQVPVPNVIGMYRDNAESTLSMSNLGTGTISYMPSDQPEGTIIKQSPEANTMVNEGTTVTIVLSSGSADTTLGSDYRNEIQQNTEGNTQDESNGGNESESGSQTGESADNTADSGSGTAGNSGAGNSGAGNSSGSDGNGTESGGASSGASQMFTVKIPDEAGDTVNVRVVADGKVVHDAVHQKTEGAVTVEIPGTSGSSVSVQAYIDGAKVSDKTITY